jgi:hypothetical protein
VRALEWKGKTEFETKGADPGEIVTVNVRQALAGVRGEARRRLDAEQGERSTIIITESKVEVMGDKKTNITMRDNYGQVGETLTNCTNMIQQQAAGERRDQLEELQREVKVLIEHLPANKKDAAPQVAKNLKELVEQATSDKPDRRWYSVSAEGLLEASKWVKNFSGNIGGTIKNLGTSLWPDFSLPESK